MCFWRLFDLKYMYVYRDWEYRKIEMKKWKLINEWGVILYGVYHTLWKILNVQITVPTAFVQYYENVIFTE